MTDTTVLPHVAGPSPAHFADDGGGGATVWPAWLGPGVIAALVVIVLVLLLIGAFLIRRWLRRLRSSGTLERGLMTVRARALPPGPGRDIAALRLRLREEVQATGLVVSSAAATDVASVQLTPVLAALQRTAAEVDVDLGRLEADPDPARQRELLVPYQREIAQLLAALVRIRDAATSTAAVNRETDLRAITAQVDDQVSYLDLYQQNYRRQYQSQRSELDIDEPPTTMGGGGAHA